MSKKSFSMRPSLLSVSISAAIGVTALGGLTTTAYAQETAEEIVVTGSRIVRRDYESNSPIVTVESGDFETQTGLNIESYLNQLPSYNPAAAPTVLTGAGGNSDVQINPVSSVGIASISLRGFGPNRSLVLVNGKRPTPINALMVTDINGVPSALVQRVETITGGASAVYGADAVAGVTNFILRDNFEGLELDVQHGMHEAGDGDENRMSAVLGANFADGRGNVTLGLERYERAAARQIERDIFVDNWRDPYSDGSFGFLQGTNAYSCSPFLHGCPNPATVGAVFADSPAGTTTLGAFYPNPFGGETFNFNSDGTVFRQNAGGLYKYTGPRDNLEYQTRRSLDTNVADITVRPEFDNLKWNNIQAFAQSPQDRYSFFASGNFDLTESVELFARATFSESQTETLLFGTNAIGGWEATIPYTPATDSPVDPTLDYTDPAIAEAVAANPGAFPNPGFIPTGAAGAQFPVPAELAILLNSRDNPGGVWQPSWNPLNSLPPRSTFNTNSVWQIETGINFDLPIGDWTGEAYVSHGQSATYNEAGGNLSLQRYRTLINQPDYGRNAVIAGNSESVNPNFGAAEVTCQSGFYDTLFSGDQPLSEDCYFAVKADLQTRTSNEQNIAELNFQGSVIDLPAGEMRGAFGYQYRENSAKFTPDILQSTASFTDQVVGVYPTGYMDASTSTNDFYVETLVPVISGMPGIQMLELELGARYSDYEHTDSETTWKALASWVVNDSFRLRGGFNRATRAPNLGELFLAPQEVFTGGANFGDACGIRSNAPFGAGGFLDDPQQEANEPTPQQVGLADGQTIEGAMSTYMICQELMGGPGSLGAEVFYEQSDASGDAGGGPFAWVYQEGNPNLISETADTWTFGFVAQSPWESPWLSGLNLSFDMYRIDIEDAIMLYSLDYAAWRCYGREVVTTQAEAAARAASEDCALISRNQNSGGPLNTSVSYDNQATIETQGFDIGINWFGDMQELFGVRGSLALNMQATVLDYYKTKQSPANYDVETDWAGSLGPNLSGTNGGAYDYRLFGTMTYMLDDWSVSLRMRHLPGVYTAAYASQQAIIDNNQRAVAGGEEIVLSYTPTTEIETASYTIFDLSFNWNINETLALRGGVTNLFEKEPSMTGRATGYPVNGDWMDGVCNGAPGCQEPTAPSLHDVGDFNGGYYDTLGRRYFLGLKASF